MKITNVVKSKSKMAFLLEDSTPAYANALRRAIVSLVPTLAIEDIEFFENNSALYDEAIAHRLGLLPLTTDLESYELPVGEKVEGVIRAASEVKLFLEAKGPGIVYASELKCKDPKVKCAYPQMPIVKLLKNQSIKLEATAVLGQAKAHAKWSAAHAHYVYQYVVEDGKSKIPVMPKDLLDQTQFEVFVKEDGMLNIPVSKAKNATVSQSDKNFVFFIESYGQLDAKEIFTDAIKRITAQIDDVQEALKAI